MNVTVIVMQKAMNVTSRQKSFQDRLTNSILIIYVMASIPLADQKHRT